MELFTLPKLLEYWETRNRLSPAAVQEVDWGRVSTLMKQLPSGLQRWVIKHAVGMCGIGKFKNRWNRSVPNQCPRCMKEEDHLHVTRCESTSAQAEWDLRVGNFSIWLASSNAAPEIVASFSQLLHCICTPAAIHQVGLHVRTRHPQLFQQAIRSQKLIGVQGMLEGLLSTYWAELQTHHFQAHGSQRTGEVWLTKAATQMIWISFHMWQHRNGFQHSDNNTQLRSRKQDAHFGIQEQFTLGVDDLPPSIKQMLRRPKREVLRLSLTEQETWLRIVRNERRRARRTLDYQHLKARKGDFCFYGVSLPNISRPQSHHQRRHVTFYRVMSPCFGGSSHPKNPIMSNVIGTSTHAR